jgi:hypothetical protein
MRMALWYLYFFFHLASTGLTSATINGNLAGVDNDIITCTGNEGSSNQPQEYIKINDGY